MDRRRPLRLLLTGLLTLVMGALAFSGATWAQTTPTSGITAVSTKPVDGADIQATPAQLVINFEQRLPDGVEAIVQLQNGNRELQNIGQPIAINGRLALRVAVLEELPAGNYTVTWLVRPKGGTAVSGKFSFTLSAPTVTTTPVTDASGSIVVPAKPDTGGLGLKKSDNSGGLLGTLGRTLGYIGLAALAGALILIALTWAEGVEYVLTLRHLWAAWVIGVVGNLLTVASAAADTKGVSVARGMIPNQWDKLLDTSSGKALVIRLLAMVGCAWVAARPERVVDSGTQWMALGLPLLGLATYGWSRQYGGTSAAAIPAGVAHAIAVAAWFGGAAILTRVVLAGPGDEDLVQAVRGFRRIAVPSLLVVVVSGVVQTSIHLDGVGNLFSTSYGKIFVLKMLAVAAMTFVAMANRSFARHRLGRSRQLDVRPAARLRRSVRTEVMAGALVFLLTGWLAGTATPGAAASDPARVNKDTYVSADGSFKAEILFGPKRVLANVELHFRLLKPEVIQDGLITFTPEDGHSAGIEVPIDGTPNYGFDADQGFTFGSGGTWTITITGKDGDGKDLPTITEQFVVNNQDGSAPLPTTATTTVTTVRRTVPQTTTTSSPPTTRPRPRPTTTTPTTTTKKKK
jgi:copper transport protein